MRTSAGVVLEGILHSATVDPAVPGTFIEGERDTASAWVRTDDGRYFQIHVTELEPTEKELAYYQALSKLNG